MNERNPLLGGLKFSIDRAPTKKETNKAEATRTKAQINKASEESADFWPEAEGPEAAAAVAPRVTKGEKAQLLEKPVEEEIPELSADDLEPLGPEIAAPMMLDDEPVNISTVQAERNESQAKAEKAAAETAAIKAEEKRAAAATAAAEKAERDLKRAQEAEKPTPLQEAAKLDISEGYEQVGEKPAGEKAARAEGGVVVEDLNDAAMAKRAAQKAEARQKALDAYAEAEGLRPTGT